MARRKGEEYPSDHRRWFRVMEDILDDPKLDDELPADVFRFYFRLLAMLNRTKAKDGVVTLTRRAMGLCSGRSQHRYSLKLASVGEVAGLYTMRTEGERTTFTVPNWAEHQGFAPAPPQPDPNETPPPNPTPKTTPTPRGNGGDSEPDFPPDPDPLVNAIGPLEGEPDEKLAWIRSGIGLEIIESADAELPEGATPKQRSAHMRRVTIARYRTYLKSDRPHQGAAKRAAIEARMSEAQSRGEAAMAALEAEEGASAWR